MRRVWGLALVAGMLGAGAGCDRGDHPEQLGRIAPEFALSDGVQAVDLGKLRGQVVVLNFWATWCVPCLEELPSLMAMQRQLPQVRVVAVSIDEDDAVYRAFLVRNHVELTTVRDGEQKVNSLYGSLRYPETYVIDRNGVVRRKFIGAQVWTSPEIEAYLKKL